MVDTDKKDTPVSADAEVVTKDVPSKERGSTHFGESELETEDYADATWAEVCHTCCVHSSQEWGMIALAIFGVIFLLYWFLFSLELLGSGAKVMAGCKAGELFGEGGNPIAGLMVGLLATALIQSSSTTTSIIIALVGSGITMEQGIYMIMGANIGTTVTNTIVAVGQMGDEHQLERAFAGATVHDMFNYMTVAILLPLEVATGYLKHLTGAMTKNASVKDDEDWEGPVKKIVAPLGALVIISNKKVTNEVAKGTKQCSDFYPMNCDPAIDPPTYTSCGGKFGLIGCSKDTDHCPAFFTPDASADDDKVSGAVVFFIGIMLLFTCLVGIVTILQKLMMGMSTRIIYKATDVNGYLAMAIGCGLTVLVQSSSITTSALTPLVGLGALRLEQMYPLTLGANIGTTITGIMASMVSNSVDSLRVALAHLMFNVTGIAIYFPIPFMRQLPMGAARRLGKATRIWRGFPFVYLAVAFGLLPMFFLGLSSLFEKDGKGFTVLGSFIVIIVAISLAYTLYWCHYKGGREKCADCMMSRERKRVTLRDLPDDMEYLKAKVALLLELAGGADVDEKAEKTNEKKNEDDDEEINA